MAIFSVLLKNLQHKGSLIEHLQRIKHLLA